MMEVEEKFFKTHPLLMDLEEQYWSMATLVSRVVDIQVHPVLLYRTFVLSQDLRIVRSEYYTKLLRKKKKTACISRFKYHTVFCLQV